MIHSCKLQFWVNLKNFLLGWKNPIKILWLCPYRKYHENCNWSGVHMKILIHLPFSFRMNNNMIQSFVFLLMLTTGIHCNFEVILNLISVYNYYLYANIIYFNQWVKIWSTFQNFFLNIFTSYIISKYLWQCR